MDFCGPRGRLCVLAGPSLCLGGAVSESWRGRLCVLAGPSLRPLAMLYAKRASPAAGEDGRSDSDAESSSTRRAHWARRDPSRRRPGGPARIARAPPRFSVGPGCSKSHWGPRGPTGDHGVLLGTTGSHWGPRGPTGDHGVPLGTTGSHRAPCFSVGRGQHAGAHAKREQRDSRSCLTAFLV
jgi:hypothetical protein